MAMTAEYQANQPDDAHVDAVCGNAKNVQPIPGSDSGIIRCP
jgi:hypothetical protein